MSNRELKIGLQGDDVLEVQNWLNKLGYNVNANGYFGEDTDAAIRAYQGSNGLTRDGVVGTQTYELLSSIMSSPVISSDNYDKNFYDVGVPKSDSVKKAEEALNSHIANKPGEYQSKWQEQLNAVMDKILNREKFSYDVNGDALYQQYKDKYIRQGKIAMQDTMGQAAAMTGGYGNSYAQAAGNQAYNAQLKNLNDVIPELYALAYDRYNQEGQDMLNEYSLYKSEENSDYEKHRQDVSDWNTMLTYLSNDYYQKYNMDYGERRDDVADEQWNETMDFNREQANKTETTVTAPTSITSVDDINKWGDIILGAESRDEAEYWAERLSKIDNDLAMSLFDQWIKEHGHG